MWRQSIFLHIAYNPYIPAIIQLQHNLFSRIRRRRAIRYLSSQHKHRANCWQDHRSEYINRSTGSSGLALDTISIDISGPRKILDITADAQTTVFSHIFILNYLVEIIAKTKRFAFALHIISAVALTSSSQSTYLDSSN